MDRVDPNRQNAPKSCRHVRHTLLCQDRGVLENQAVTCLGHCKLRLDGETIRQTRRINLSKHSGVQDPAIRLGPEARCSGP